MVWDFMYSRSICRDVCLVLRGFKGRTHGIGAAACVGGTDFDFLRCTFASAFVVNTILYFTHYTA